MTEGPYTPLNTPSQDSDFSGTPSQVSFELNVLDDSDYETDAENKFCNDYHITFTNDKEIVQYAYRGLGGLTYIKTANDICKLDKAMSEMCRPQTAK